jgi:hypothetical protein
VRFKFVATATPSPNRTKELIHYAGFLGIMDTGQALTRFFQRNFGTAGDLTLFPHKEDEFWLWVHSWAVFLQSPVRSRLFRRRLCAAADHGELARGADRPFDGRLRPRRAGPADPQHGARRDSRRVPPSATAWRRASPRWSS